MAFSDPEAAKPVDRYLEINEMRLHYLEGGSPHFEPLLVLHGVMGHSHMWDDVAPVLAARYRVLSLDQRGYGESDWSKDASYSIYDYYTTSADLSMRWNSAISIWQAIPWGVETPYSTRSAPRHRK